MHVGATLFVDTTTVMFGKLLLAMFLGAILGTERALIAKQAAGTRTFGLVALSACLFIVTSNYVDTSYIGIVSFDPMHIAVGIITGIGFVGGGLIIFRGDSVHGATTAAGLWVATAVGMAVGFGLYSVAMFATVLALILFTGLWYVEERFKHWFISYETQDSGHIHHGN